MAAGTLWGHRPGDTWLHRAPARTKLLALIAFALVVVATPREWFLAFAVYGALVITVLAMGRVPILIVLKRMVIEVPFLVFALLMPLIADGSAHRRVGHVSVDRGPVGGLGPARQGDARRARIDRSDRHDRTAPDRPRPRAAAPPPPAHLDHGLHAALSRSDRGRRLADADGPGRARVRRVGASGAGGSSRPVSAGCSCAHTAEANACTWRCSRAATARSRRDPDTSGRGRRRGAGTAVRLPRRTGRGRPGAGRRRASTSRRASAWPSSGRTARARPR